MALHTDIPTSADVTGLLERRSDACVSIYLPTTRVTGIAEADRIEFKNLAADAVRQLDDAGHDKRAVGELREGLEGIEADEEFWSRQANSLAVFATPGSVRAFRLPNRLTAMVEVSDRFHVKPLLRAVTFPQAAYVLALSQGAARLLEIAADVPPAELRVPDLPTDVATAVGKESITDRAPRRRIQGSEGQKLRMRQYAKRVDEALRPVLVGADLPLVLASTEPLDAIFRSVCSYPGLAAESIAGNPDRTSDAALADAARGVLDGIYAADVAETRDLFEQRLGQDRATTDLARAARAATFGAVQTAVLDIDQTIPGSIDEETGAVTLDAEDDAVNYGVVDEIARRVVLTGGRVLAVRAEDVPEGAPVAAILRYAV